MTEMKGYRKLPSSPGPAFQLMETYIYSAKTWADCTEEAAQRVKKDLEKVVPVREIIAQPRANSTYS